MKLVTMGFLQPSDIDDLQGQCCLVLVGSPDEVRSAAMLMYQEIDITLSLAAPAPSPTGTGPSESKAEP